MRTIHNFILEKLKLNSQSKTWSIEDAKVGEFITARKNIERYSPQAIMQQNISLYNSILNIE
jgi:hypothetical protein